MGSRYLVLAMLLCGLCVSHSFQSTHCPNLHFSEILLFDTHSTDFPFQEDIPIIEKNRMNHQFFPGKNQFKTLKNATSLLENQFLCMWNDKERLLMDSTQTCLISRGKVTKKDSFVVFSPCYPTVFNSSQNMLVVELADNTFEALKPILPLEGSTKSVTERINFASSKAGAISLAKSKGMTGNNEVLSSNKYKYCITTCKSNKWFVFSLPEMFLIDAIATANYERFSSSVQKFVLYGSPVYPTNSWSFIGFFEAKDGSSLQVFPIPIPVWTKFIKFEWLSWYRQEAMCTMSEIRVYGSNMINTMLQTDFSKSDSRSAGLKEIIDEETQEVSVEDNPPSSTERSSSPISPEFQPLYELYKRCEEEQGEMTFSIALLSNKTKQKIHGLKERLGFLENNTAQLYSLFEEQTRKLETLEHSLHSLQRTLQEITSKSRPSTLWLTVLILGVFACWQILFIPTQPRQEGVNKQEFERASKQIQLLQKEIEQLQQKEVKHKNLAEESNNMLMDDSREWKQVKKRSRK